MAFFRKSALEKGLEEILGPEGLLKEQADVVCYGFDSSGLESPPDLVALPKDIEQVRRVVGLCNSLEVAVTPRGAGSSTTGSAVPVCGGVVLCLSRMNRIIQIDPVELTARVEPGVVTGHLQKRVERHGLFYPPDPASLAFCTIGGNVATGAGGARAVKYGVTKDYVKGLKVVLADGSLIETGVQTAKGVVGYDLTRLFVGSEGTLGVVVEVVLRLIPRPRAVGTLAAFFSDMDLAVDAVSNLFESAVLPRCAEFLDKKSLDAVSSTLPFQVPTGSEAFILVEVDGDKPSVVHQLKEAAVCLERAGALSIVEPANRDERNKIWKVRRGVSPALRGLGYDTKVSEDVCVPRRAIKEMLAFLLRLEKGFGVDIFCFGHIGDGNLHVNLLFNKSDLDPKDLQKIVAMIMNKAVELGGTISGEHGIGLTKMKYINIEHSEKVLGLEREIKRVFDPKGILNPGKIFKE